MRSRAADRRTGRGRSGDRSRARRSAERTHVRLGGVDGGAPPGTRQVVTVNHTRGYHARVDLLGAHRRPTGGSGGCTASDGRIGYGGLVVGTRRHQGTGTTPLGTYDLPSAFGTHPRATPAGSCAYRKIRTRRLLGRGQRLGVLQPLPQPASGRLPLVAPGRATRTAPSGSPTTPGSTSGRSSPASTTTRCGTAAPASSCTSTASGATAGCVSAPRWFIKTLIGRLDPTRRARDRDRALMPGPGVKEDVRVDVEGRHPDDQQPRQGALSADRHHQGRGAQLLRPGRPGAAAAPRGPRA